MANDYENPLRDPHLRAYLEHVANDPLRPRVYTTFLATRTILKQFDAFLSAIGQTCETVESFEFEDYLGGLLKRGLARSTVRQHQIQVKGVIHHHQKRVRRGQVAMWDFTGTAGVQVPDPNPKTYTADQMRRMHTEIRTPDDEWLFMGLALTGLRKEIEFAKLMWRQVDWTNWALEIGGWDETEGARGKGGKSRRVPIHPVLRDLLTKLYNASEGDRYILQTDRGSYPRTATVSKRMAHIFKPAGVEGNARMMRATFNTSMMDNGAEERLAEIVMGHAKASVNRKHYQRDNWYRLEDTVKLAYREDPFWLSPAVTPLRKTA